MLRSFVRLFVCFTAIGIARAQEPPCPYALQGRVEDEHDASALGLAEVRVVELGRSVLADAEGRFVIEGLCAGRFTLRAAHVGCDPVEVVVVVPADKPVRIRLEHHAEELKQVEVARQRPDEHVGQSHQHLDRAAMEKNSGRGLAELLQNVPGVTVLQSGPTISKPIIHGLSGNRVLILNQGIRQEDQQWGTEHAPNLDPLSSDRVTVVKGAASVQYGSDALGGVVITEPVELPTEAGVNGEVRGVGGMNGGGGGAQGLLQGGVKGWRGAGWRVQGSGRWFGDSRAARYVLSNTGLREGGLSASVGYRDHRWNTSAYYSWFTRELGILRASHIGNLTDLGNAITTGEPWYTAPFTYAIDAPRQEVRHHLFKGEAGYAVGERDRLVLTYGYQADDRQEYDVRRGGRSGIPALDLFLATHTADLVLKHWIGKHLHGRAGMNGVLQENLNDPGTGVRPLIPNYRKASMGAFVLEHYPVSSKVEVEAGARLERTELDVAKYDADDRLVRPRHTFTNSAFTAGANWSVRDSVRLRFNLGAAYRPPHVSELYSEGLHHGAAAIEEGDAALASERSFKATADLDARALKGRLRMEVTLYADRINGFIYLRPEGVRLTVRGAFPVFRYTATDAFLFGLDASFRYRLTARWSARARMSTVRGRDIGRDEWLFQLPSDRVENALLLELPQAGAWSAVEVTATSGVVFVQQRIPVALDFTTPPATYHLLGLSASAVRRLGKNHLRVGLRGDNLLNAAYRDYLDRFRYFADARGADITCWITYVFGQNH